MVVRRHHEPRNGVVVLGCLLEANCSTRDTRLDFTDTFMPIHGIVFLIIIHSRIDQKHPVLEVEVGRFLSGCGWVVHLEVVTPFKVVRVDLWRDASLVFDVGQEPSVLATTQASVLPENKGNVSVAEGVWQAVGGIQEKHALSQLHDITSGSITYRAPKSIYFKIKSIEKPTVK